MSRIIISLRFGKNINHGRRIYQADTIYIRPSLSNSNDIGFLTKFSDLIFKEFPFKVARQLSVATWCYLVIYIVPGSISAFHTTTGLFFLWQQVFNAFKEVLLYLANKAFCRSTKVCFLEFFDVLQNIVSSFYFLSLSKCYLFVYNMFILHLIGWSASGSVDSTVNAARLLGDHWFKDFAEGDSFSELWRLLC